MEACIYVFFLSYSQHSRGPVQDSNCHRNLIYDIWFSFLNYLVAALWCSDTNDTPKHILPQTPTNDCMSTLDIGIRVLSGSLSAESPSKAKNIRVYFACPIFFGNGAIQTSNQFLQATSVPHLWIMGVNILQCAHNESPTFVSVAHRQKFSTQFTLNRRMYCTGCAVIHTFIW
jgi:hypothetical protein